MASKILKSIKQRDSFYHTIRRLYDQALEYKLTYDEILNLRSRDILGTQAYQSLPRWASAQVDGFFDALMGATSGQLFHVDCEDRWMLDGKMYARNDPDKEEMFKGRWNEVRYVGLFYKGTDKPMSRSETSK